MGLIDPTDGFTAWERLTRRDWDEMVEVLLYTMHKDREIWQSTPFRGDGGDGGRDFTTTRLSDGYTRIFQLKFFPDGFSKTQRHRRNQIKASFRAAMKHEPDEWTLVVPRNTTQGEKDFINGLVELVPADRTKAPLVITEMTAVHLNEELSQHPSLQASFKNGEYRKLAELFNLERGIVPSSTEAVQDRVKAVQRAIDAADPDWTFEFSTVGGVVTQHLTPKHPNAFQRSPIRVEVVTDIPEASAELRSEIRAALSFGLDQTVTIPPQYVERYTVTGPALVATDRERVGVVIQTATSKPEHLKPPMISLINDEERVTTSVQCRIEHANSGTDGFSLRVRVYPNLTLTWLVPLDANLPVDVRLSSVVDDHSLTDIRRASAFAIALFSGARLKIDLREAGVIDLAGGKAPNANQPDLSHLRELHDLADDLLVIEERTGISVLLPDSYRKRDRARLRAVRLMVEGCCTALPGAMSYGVVFDNVSEMPPQLIEKFAAAEPVSLWMREDHAIEVGDLAFDLGEIVFGSAQMILSDPTAASAAMRGGSDTVSTRLQPADGGFFVAFAPRFVRDPHERLSVTRWNLEGIEEPGSTQGYETAVHLPPSDSMQPGGMVMSRPRSQQSR